ncbi:DUF5131 family protein [Micromonospora fulviviridis]|uniref:DUF5131 family protein n=1 Tax=Micromonospora fulviviridis TaxID=47860 RepID=UPI0037BBFB69
MDNSRIEWTNATWNPVTGCTKVSPGCDHCYAETFAERFRGVPGHHFEQGFDLVLRPERLGIPLRWKRPRRIFVNSMSDLFHDQVPAEFIAEVFAVMAAAHWHTFQLLTKRHGRMRSLLNDPEFRTLVRCESATLAHEGIDVTTNNPWETWPLPNVWLGVSVEDQRRDFRIPALLDTPAAVRWLSCEPLIGPLDLARFLHWRPIGANFQNLPLPPAHAEACGLPALHWVVAGGESGRQARPMHPDWARQLRDQCRTAGIPLFFKQWGEWAPVGPLYEQDADDPEADEARMEAAAQEVNGVRVIELERSGYVVDGHQATDKRTWLMARHGKRKAGRALDGWTHDEYPATSADLTAAGSACTAPADGPATALPHGAGHAGPAPAPPPSSGGGAGVTPAGWRHEADVYAEAGQEQPPWSKSGPLGLCPMVCPTHNRHCDNRAHHPDDHACSLCDGWRPWRLP